MKEKNHIWMDIAVVGVIVGQILLCVAPRKPAVTFRPTDLSKMTPGSSVQIELKGQSFRIEIPKGESPESGTFSIYPSLGKPIRGIKRDGELKGLVPGQVIEGHPQIEVIIRSKAQGHTLTSVTLEPTGFDYAPEMNPQPHVQTSVPIQVTSFVIRPTSTYVRKSGPVPVSKQQVPLKVLK